MNIRPDKEIEVQVFIIDVEGMTGHLRAGIRGDAGPLWYRATLTGFELVYDDTELEAAYQQLLKEELKEEINDDRSIKA